MRMVVLCEAPHHAAVLENPSACDASPASLRCLGCDCSRLEIGPLEEPNERVDLSVLPAFIPLAFALFFAEAHYNLHEHKVMV